MRPPRAAACRKNSARRSSCRAIWNHIPFGAETAGLDVLDATAIDRALAEEGAGHVEGAAAGNRQMVGYAATPNIGDTTAEIRRELQRAARRDVQRAARNSRARTRRARCQAARQNVLDRAREQHDVLVELPDRLMTPPDPAISWTAPPAFAIRESLFWMVRPELVTPDETTVVVLKSSPSINFGREIGVVAARKKRRDKIALRPKCCIKSR